MYIYIMKSNESLTEAKDLLASSGYKLVGNSIIPPDVDSPLDAISIQDQLGDLGYRLQYIGNILKLVKVEV